MANKKELELIGKQQLEIEQLKLKISDAHSCFNKIHSMLICVGGGLNDNKLQYTKAQMLELYRINQICEENLP